MNTCIDYWQMTKYRDATAPPFFKHRIVSFKKWIWYCFFWRLKKQQQQNRKTSLMTDLFKISIICEY